MLLWVQKP